MLEVEYNNNKLFLQNAKTFLHKWKVSFLVIGILYRDVFDEMRNQSVLKKKK
jgi:hypothetical protein